MVQPYGQKIIQETDTERERESERESEKEGGRDRERETVGLKGKGQRLGVVTKRLGARLEFDSRDRSLTGKAGH